jgi:hypothetical protein
MLNFDKTIEDLRSVSSNVCEYLDTKKYLQIFTEESLTDEALLQTCYEIVIDDLLEIGITFHCDLVDLFTNFYDMETIWMLKLIFSIEHLKNVLENDSELRELVSTIISDESDQKLIRVLETLTYTYPDNEMYDRVYKFLEDKVVETGEFIIYIENVIDLSTQLLDFDEIPDDDMAKIDQLIHHVQTSQNKAKEIFDIAAELYPEIDTIRLNRDYKRYNRDKLYPNNINAYAWFVDIELSNTELYPHEKPLYDKLDYEHNVRNNHHIEYYENLPHTTISKEDVLNLLANCYEPNKSSSKGDIIKKMDDIYHQLILKHDVFDTYSEFIKQLVDRIDL